MVVINQYKGIDIDYNSNELFNFQFEGIKSLNMRTEIEAKEAIDIEIKRIEERKAKEQEIKELAEKSIYKVGFADPSYFKDSISIINTLTSECRFVFEQDKITVCVIDPANVALIKYEIFSSLCVQYEVPKRCAIALNISNLKKILARCDKNDLLFLENSEDKCIKITFKGRTTRSYNLHYIEYEEAEHKIPDLVFTSKVTIPIATFEKQIYDGDKIAESLQFSIHEGNFEISAEGDLTKYLAINKPDESIEVKGTEGERVKYTIEYLKRFCSCKKITNSVVLNFKKDYPLKMEVNILDKLQMYFILAPRVEND